MKIEDIEVSEEIRKRGGKTFIIRPIREVNVRSLPHVMRADFGFFASVPINNVEQYDVKLQLLDPNGDYAFSFAVDLRTEVGTVSLVLPRNSQPPTSPFAQKVSPVVCAELDLQFAGTYKLQVVVNGEVEKSVIFNVKLATNGKSVKKTKPMIIPALKRWILAS
jgi:hypothetical protein